ncbi:response regulator [Pseudoroseicyclus sp. H15]
MMETLKIIDLPEPSPPLRLVATAPAAPRHLRVLVLDDSEVDRMRIARLLVHATNVVETEFAASLAEFEAALDDECIDIALLDYSLPEGTGLDALRSLRHHPLQAAARPIVIAGDCPAEIAVAAMKEGSYNCLDKHSLTARSLGEAIAEALTGKALSPPPRPVSQSGLAQLKPASRLMRQLIEELHGPARQGIAQERALQELASLSATLEAFVKAQSGEAEGPVGLLN